MGVWVEWWKVIVIVFDYGNYGKSGKKRKWACASRSLGLPFFSGRFAQNLRKINLKILEKLLGDFDLDFE
jgi:hypothetical protein